MSEQWHPERLDEEHLWSRYAWNTERAEYHRRQAEKDLAELVVRGCINEYPTYPTDLEGQPQQTKEQIDG